MQLLISDIRPEAEDIVSLTLRHPNGEPLPGWEPGAHIDVEPVPGLVRQYSLCGDQQDLSSYKIAVLKDLFGRGGSVAMHEKLRRGDHVTVSLPRNHFRLEPARAYVFIAGGIGITPLLPMVLTAERQGIPWHLYFTGRARRHMAFLNQLENHAPNIQIKAKSEGGGIALKTLLAAVGDADIYCCGPQRMIDEAVEFCSQTGLAARLHVERFSAVKRDEAAENLPFTAVMAASGKEVHVPGTASLLKCLLDAGADVLYSCEEGTCGSCEIRVIEGVPDHRDSLLSEAERQRNDRIYPCVSRARSARLVLDL